ncbi:uncharacterized protein KY384_000913 [Bacidia gigantensis]|uniref:uncharacterized protein n=1 Tax=Bacidia gigantensis TaxID=2732470 RepID=UPI001D04E626|nr:uncharacterized protein KY384_000913 [Bacidia gigantensis]KAG8534070.1 hypothetical protein KY384_000913 [Bacidia gigantensis]
MIFTSTPVSNKLSSLIERDESPDNGPSAIDALVSSPTASNIEPNPVQFGMLSAAVHTPPSSPRMISSNDEMHSSKIQQSAKKPLQAQGPLSSHPMNQLPRSPSKIAVPVGTHRTPDKKHADQTQPLVSPAFEFCFDQPASKLSHDARKIMDSVREEAARIKAQMKEKREMQEQSDEQASQGPGPSILAGRQIKKAKGKSGRYSEAHREQFKMMDSIASHGSTWKTKLQSAASSPLKRSPSKAGLDEAQNSILRSKSSRNVQDFDGDRLENPTPGKKLKRCHREDVSSAGSALGNPSSASTEHPKRLPPFDLPSAATTPTKASLARSASVKSFKTSMIPSLTKSVSMKTLKSTRVPMTEPSNKRQGSWSRFGGNVKSILSRAQPKFSNDPLKIAGGTHLPMPKEKPDMEKSLPRSPGTPTIKHVNFTPSTRSRHEAATTSIIQTPSKIAVRPSTEPRVTTIKIPLNDEPIFYPDLAQSPHVTTSRGRSPKPTPAPRQPSEMPGDFTFRADTGSAITFNPQNNTTSPVRSLAQSSIPCSAARTIRPVRPSGTAPSTSLPGTFPTISSPVPLSGGGIEHGIANKKRKHDDSSDTEQGDNTENIDPNTTSNVPSKDAVKDEDGPKAKKQRTVQAEPRKTPGSARRQTSFGGAMGSPKKKGGLSLSRLNMLARPKQR